MNTYLQVIHYKWSHPWADLNGLQSLDTRLQFITRLCWKKKIQKITYHQVPREGGKKIVMENYDRRCFEIESLKEEYESRRNSMNPNYALLSYNETDSSVVSHSLENGHQETGFNGTIFSSDPESV